METCFLNSKKFLFEVLLDFSFTLMLIWPACLSAQHYPPQMFLDNLTSSMQNAAAATSSAALVSSSSSHYDAISHAASSFHDTRVLTGGGGGTGGGADGGISDIISLDWATPYWTWWSLVLFLMWNIVNVQFSTRALWWWQNPVFNNASISMINAMDHINWRYES